MEVVEWLRSGLEAFVEVAQLCLEAISVVCVTVGLVKTLQLAIALNRRYRGGPYPFNQVRLRFGIWLALALEFQLGADILATTIAPSLEMLVQLAIIAIIRTFLNYFLSKELEAELALEKERSKTAQEPLITPEPFESGRPQP